MRFRKKSGRDGRQVSYPISPKLNRFDVSMVKAELQPVEGLSIGQLQGPRLKKAIGARQVVKGYHNKHKDGSGNFGIVIRMYDPHGMGGEACYELHGDYGVTGRITDLNFGTCSGPGSPVPLTGFEELVQAIKERIQKLVEFEEARLMEEEKKKEEEEEHKVGTVEYLLTRGINTSKSFTLAYELPYGKDYGELKLHGTGQESIKRKTEAMSFSEFSSKVEAFLTAKYGELQYLGGDFRQEKKGNTFVEVHFDPWGGVFQIHITIKKTSP